MHAHTGDRSGTVMVWDLTAGAASWSAHKAHAGHVTALGWLQRSKDGGHAQHSSDMLLTGGQDGALKVWDGRGGNCVATVPNLHNNDRGKGAVGNITAGD